MNGNGHALTNAADGLDAKNVRLTARESDVTEKVLSIVAKGVGAELRGLSRRLDEMESVVRALAQSAAGRHE